MEIGQPLRIILALLALGLVGCATPQNIRDKSTATTELYTQLLAAHRAFAAAMEAEYKQRDRLAAEIAVRTGEAKEDLQTPVPEPKDTALAKEALQASESLLMISKIAYGTVDRFLQVNVVDLDEVKALTGKLTEATGGQ